jgi:UDP-N-acetylmuramate dehydrogenase
VSKTRPLQFLLDATLQPYNTLALQARASALVSVTSDQELADAFTWAAQNDLPVVPLGGGSNVVLARDLDALVVRQNTRGIETLYTSDDKVILRVAAGENWHALVQWSLQHSLYGLENLALIPGNVGAAPMQNIGAYGVELQSCLLQVHAMHIADGRAITLSREKCEFGYRDSIFKHDLRDTLVITAVDLQLSRKPRLHTEYPALASLLRETVSEAVTPQDVFNAVVSIRRSKLPDPSIEPNAGSFFKNPLVATDHARELMEKFPGLPGYPQADGSVKLAAGWMIDHCGWKGYREDDVGVHPEHALVIVNYGNENGERLLSMASEIAATVADTFAVQLVIEPRVYG